MAKIDVFFRFYSFLWLSASLKYVNFSHKLEIPQIKWKKYVNFWHKSGKLAKQIKDDYYINLKNTQIRRILIIFPTIWTGKAWIISLVQNEGKIDNGKTIITVLCDDFTTPCENWICKLSLSRKNFLWVKLCVFRFTA